MNENFETNAVPTAPAVPTEQPVAAPAAPVEAPAAPVAVAPTAPITGVVMPQAAPATVSPYSFAALRRKWWFWAILGACLVGLIFGIAGIGKGGSSGSDYNGGGSSYNGGSYGGGSVFGDTYVNMVKNATHSSYGIQYGKAFDRFFSSPSWRSFDSTTGKKVVEFTGRFSYSGSPATAKIQFTLDVSGGTFTATYLSINDVSQNQLMLSAMIQKVFESYY